MGGFSEKPSQEALGDCDETAYLYLLYDKTNQKALELHIMSNPFPAFPVLGVEEGGQNNRELAYMLLLGKTEDTYEEAAEGLMKELRKLDTVGGVRCHGYYDRNDK